MTESLNNISVIIKTYDDRHVRHPDAALPPLRDILRGTLKILAEQTITPTEVVIVDSSAGNGILDIIQAYQPTASQELPYCLRHVRVAPEDFTYTHALNVGINAASGAILISLSGDATPANESWLEELIAPLKDIDVAGAYSRHVARPGMRLSMAERLRLWWRYRSRKTRVRARDHVFSNASSSFRASDMEVYPFDESLTELEDYAWAKEVQQAGFHIIYAGRSEVYHSHATKTWPTLKRMLYYAWLRIKTDLE